MIISPKWDYSFKELFRNMVVLKYFISVVLEIPVEEIRSVRLLNTNLRRRYRYQKQGILDVLAELNDNTKINIELHVIELNKVLTGQTIDEWIRFFNAKTQEDLDMLRSQTKSAGIMEAIKEIEHMSLTHYARMRYEEYLKRIMDRKAQDAYVYEQGQQAGRQEGQQSMMELISMMNAGGDADKVVQVSNPDVLEAMKEKYGIE